MAEINTPLLFLTTENKDARLDSPFLFVSTKNRDAKLQNLLAFTTVLEAEKLDENIRGIFTGVKAGVDIKDIHLLATAGGNKEKKVSIQADTSRAVAPYKEYCGDTKRSKRNVYSFSADTVRVTSVGIKQVTLFVDTQVSASNRYEITADASRLVYLETSILGDTDRDVVDKRQKEITLTADVIVQYVMPVRMSADTGRSRVYALDLEGDSNRQLSALRETLCDTLRRVPFDTTLNSNPAWLNPFQPQARKEKHGPVSMLISLNEMTLADSFELQTTQNIDVMDALRGEILDFKYSYIAESTTQRDMVRTVKGMYDVDALLYTPMTYISDGEKHSIAFHSERIASALGKRLNLQIESFTPSAAYTVNLQTYGDIISTLFGWTNQIPTRQINVFLRAGDNSLNIIQRGYEKNRVDLTGTKHTRPNIHREIVRTAWTYAEDGNGNSNSNNKAHSLTIEPIPFSGTISWEEASCTYVNGYLVRSVQQGDTVTYTYSQGGYITSKHTVHADGTTTKVVYHYASLGSRNVAIGSEVETHTDAKGKERIRKTIHTPLGGGWYGSSVYVNGKYQGSTVAQGNPAAKASQYLRDQESITFGGAKYRMVSDAPGDTVLLGYADCPVEEDALKARLTAELKALNRKTKETVSFDLYEYGHVVDFTDRVTYRGAEYFLQSNTITRSLSELKQSITLVRWY